MTVLVPTPRQCLAMGMKTDYWPFASRQKINGGTVDQVHERGEDRIRKTEKNTTGIGPHAWAIAERADPSPTPAIGRGLSGNRAGCGIRAS